MDITISNIGIRTANNNKFFDLFDRDGLTLLTDYRYLNKDIVIKNKNGDSEIELGGERDRHKLTSIDELRNTFDEFVSTVVQVIHSEPMSFIPEDHAIYFEGEESQTVLDCSNLNKDLLVEQLIFDILFDKYLKDAEEITLYKYACEMGNLLNDEKKFFSSPDAIRNTLKEGMKDNYKRMKYSQLREEVVELGVDPVMYDKYYTPVAKENIKKKKPKYIWNHIFYNRYFLTYRQYRRELKKDGNYSYGAIIEDLNEYNRFVEKLLPDENETPKKYYFMTMEYYQLESYKRLDYIFKLINTLSLEDINKIDRSNFLIKRFCPLVLVPFERDNKLCFDFRHKYYRPLLLVEEALREQMLESGEFNYGLYADKLLKYQIVRAKAYELFKYHAEYISSDYIDIKKFIREKYNMLSYHQTNDVWKTIKDKEWKRMDDETKRQIKQLVHSFFSINDALFWESPKRDFSIPPK